MKISEREIKRRNGVVVVAGYCQLHDTLQHCYDHRHFHTEGVYGWNADVYEFGRFALLTGYRWSGAYFMLEHEFCQKWERKTAQHCAKVNIGNRSVLQRRNMVATFREHFEKAVMAEVAKDIAAKQKKREKRNRKRTKAA